MWNRLNYGFTERIVVCIKESILNAVYEVLVPFSAFLADTISIAMMLAVALWGVRVAGGYREAVLHKGMMLLAIKIGVVVVFTANFASSYFDPLNARGGLFGMMMDAVEDILGIVTNYISFSTIIKCPNIDSPLAAPNIGSSIVWARVDCALETLIGGVFPLLFKPPYYSLVLGITGFLILCIFSGPLGVFIALAGFYLIFKFIMTLIRAAYIYIMSYTALAIMVLISPLFITLILFNVTKQYFEKWARLTVSFLLQPIFLFAYLSMLVAAFDAVIFTGPNSLYRAVAGAQMDGKRLGYPELVVPPVDNPADFFVMGEKLNTGTVAGNPIYADDTHGAIAINIDPEQARRDLGVPVTTDSGILDTTGEIVTTSADWDNPDGLFGFLNRSGLSKNFFKIDIPHKVIDWNVLAKWSTNGSTPANCTAAADVDVCITTSYVVRLVLSIIMAVLVSYIFIAMLDYLPFIGSGIAGDTASFPVFGIKNKDHNMGVPGDGMLGSLRKKLSAKFGLGG